MFEKDISNLAKPEIKGRGFLQSGNEIIETQTYYTEPENDWVFDETQKMTYDNPVYIEQKKRKHENIDDSGFTIPKKLSELDDTDEQPEVNTFDENDDDDWDDDWDDEPEEVVEKPISFKKEPPNMPNTNSGGLSSFMDEFEAKEKAKNDDINNFINSFGSSDTSPESVSQPSNKSILFEEQPQVNSPQINSPTESNSQQKKVIKFKF